MSREFGRAIGARAALLALLAFGPSAPAAAAETGTAAEAAAELRSGDGNARRKAAEGLGGLSSPEAVRLLAEAYRAEAHDAFGVKAACAEALGRTGLPEAAAPLGEMLGDPDYWVRRKAAEALGRIPGPGAVQALGRARAEADPRVRAAAVGSLGARGEWAAVEAALGDPDDRVVAAAVEAFAASPAPKADEILVRAAESPAWQVRYRAAAALARRGDPRGISVLEEGIRGRVHAGCALREASSAGAGAVPLLASLFRCPDLEEPGRVLDALEAIPDPAATEFFVALATDPAAAAAHRVRGASAAFDRRHELSTGQVGRLADLLAEADPNLVAVALQVLGDAGGASYLPRVSPLVSHENPVIRHFALVNVAAFGKADHEPLLVAALADPNGANVRLALEALGRVGTRAALPAIRPLAADLRLRRYAEAAIEAIEARP